MDVDKGASFLIAFVDGARVHGLCYGRWCSWKLRSLLPSLVCIVIMIVADLDLSPKDGKESLAG
jgi:hypothetical protein